MNPIPLNLSKEDQSELKWRCKYEENWRIRERVATILLLDTGLSCEKVALELNLSRGTVQTTKTGWMREKFDSLKDKARTGAPRKIKPQEEKMLLALAQEKPLCATELLQVHLDNGGERVHSETIRRLLKANQMSWKRTRHSLKKKGCGGL
jgi:transposase